MNSNRMTVKAKLSTAFGLLALVVLIVAGISLKSLTDANDRFYGFVTGINARAELAESIRTAVDDRAMAVRNLVLVSTPADLAVEKAAVLDAEQRVENRLEKFNAMIANANDMSDEARRLAAEIPRIEALYRPVALDINRLASNNQRSRDRRDQYEMQTLACFADKGIQ
jgi:hypothetical protein